MSEIASPGLYLLLTDDFTPKRELFALLESSRGERAAIVSAGETARLLERERRLDESDLKGGAPDLGRSLGDLFDLNGGDSAGSRAAELSGELGLDSIQDRGIRAYSTGELRKLALLTALLADPPLLILDEPFDGLDASSRERFIEIIKDEARRRSILVVSGRRSDLELLGEDIHTLGREHFKNNRARIPEAAASSRSFAEKQASCGRREILIGLECVSVSYGEIPILRDLSFEVARGEAWRIAGPNGAGKTTLTELITGENQKAYGQNIWLFGRKKGSGESVWEIKERIGHLSPALHRRISPRDRVEATIISGIYDSIGLYREPNDRDRRRAAELASLFGIDDLLAKRMGELSFGHQRVALALRGVIKEPELLIMDEPCQGLDDANTETLLETVSRLIDHQLGTLLFISHDPDQKIRGLTHTLELYADPRGGYRGRVHCEGRRNGHQAL